LNEASHGGPTCRYAIGVLSRGEAVSNSSYNMKIIRTKNRTRVSGKSEIEGEGAARA